MNILLVEDNPRILEEFEHIIKFKLNREDIFFKSTLKGSTAMDISENIDVDIFIIDINLPDMNGLKLALNLRNKYKLNPIIIESAIKDDSYKAEVHNKIQNTAYITKPLEHDQVIKKLLNALDIADKMHVKKLELTDAKKTISYHISDIIYIEKIKNSKKIVLTWYRPEHGLVQDTFNMSINQLKEIVATNDLKQVHRNFMVNPAHIAKIDYIDKSIRLRHTVVQIPIGSTFMDDMKYLN